MQMIRHARPRLSSGSVASVHGLRDCDKRQATDTSCCETSDVQIPLGCLSEGVVHWGRRGRFDSPEGPPVLPLGVLCVPYRTVRQSWGSGSSGRCDPWSGHNTSNLVRQQYLHSHDGLVQGFKGARVCGVGRTVDGDARWTHSRRWDFIGIPPPKAPLRTGFARLVWPRRLVSKASTLSGRQTTL